MKIRLDKLLVERGLVTSRERGQSLILAGRVLVNEQKIEKAGAAVEDDAEVRFLGGDLKYVSRGGLKLERALEYWKIDVAGKICADIGASTGGFTDCMLQNGAAKVIAIDTGYGQIDARLRSDERVSLMERTNARHLQRGAVPFAVEFVAMDVSFISATLVLPAVVNVVLHATELRRELVLLIKPQFEVGRAKVGKGGIVRDERAQLQSVEKVKAAVKELGGEQVQTIDSPITGAEGNREFLLHAVWSARLNG